MAKITRSVSSVDGTDLLTTLAKYGVGSVIAMYLVYMMTQGLQADVRGIRVEHREMATYLQAICLGVTKDESQQWRCLPQHENSFSSNQIR